MAKSNFIVRGGADFSGIYKEFNKVQKQISTFQSTVSKVTKRIGIALSGLAVGKLIKDSTEVAMSVESAMDNISRNMSNSSKAFNSWVQTQSKALGMAKADAYEYGSTFSNLLGSFTSNTKEVADQTQELMKAAAIISSKTGRTYEDTANRIRSGLLGSTEAIEDLGVYTQVSMLESTEAFKKFANGKSWSQLTYQTQQQIRLAAILEQTYKRYGDTLADTTQTRQSQLIASLKNIQLSLGQAFLPIYNAVLPALTAMSNAIGNVVSRLAQFTQALFGKANVSKTVGEQADSITDLGNATEKAGKQAKGALASFDEINSLGSSNDSAINSIAETTNTGGVSDTGTEVAVPSNIDKAIENFKKLFEPLNNINFDNLNNALNNLRLALEPLTATLFRGLEWAITNIFIPLSKITIEYVIPAFLNTLALAMQSLNVILENSIPIISGIALAFVTWKAIEFANYVKYIGALTNTTGFTALFNAIKQLSFVGFAGLKTKIMGVLEPMKIFALNMLSAVKNAGLLLIELGKQTIALIANAAQWVWNKTVIVASTVAQTAMTIATAAWNAICVVATTVTSAFGAAIAFLTSPIGLVILAITALVAIIALLIKHWDDVKNAAALCWDSIKNVFSKAANWFSTNVTTPIKNEFKSVINLLIGMVEGFINSFVKGINVVIDTLNRLNIKVPDWVPGIGGQTWGFNISNVKQISIPKLARGGIIDSPTIAMLGERGKEAVVPLENTAFVDTLASAVGNAVITAMQFNNSNNTSTEPPILQLDGTTFARLINSYLTKENSRIGNKLIIETT